MKNYLHHSLFVILLLSSPVFCLAQERSPAVANPPPAVTTALLESGWIRFDSVKGRFSILLPGVPGEEVQTVDSAAGKLDMHIVILPTSTPFMVMHADYPYSIEDPSRVKLALDGGRDMAVKNIKGQVLEEKDITFDGHPGRYLKIKAANGFIVRSNIIVVGNRAYTLAYITTNEGSDSASQVRLYEEIATKFLNSFKLISDEQSSAQESSEAQGEVDRLVKEGVVAYGLRTDIGGTLDPETPFRIKTISLPQPQYPARAKAVRASGKVVVQIMVDESGRVIAAQVVSGHPLLRAVSLEAVREALFTPPTLNGRAVKIVGTIHYNFTLQ